MASYRFTIVVERDEDGAYIALCPALQGCYSQGDTYEEAVEHLTGCGPPAHRGPAWDRQSHPYRGRSR